MRIPQIEELSGLMLEVPALVALQEDRQNEFVAAVSAWLRAVEERLTANRVYAAGIVAAIRSDLLSIIAGRLPSEFGFRAHTSPTKIVVAGSSRALREAVGVLSGVLDAERERLRGADALVMQVVAVAWSKGILDSVGQAVFASLDDRMSRTRAVLLGDSDTAAGVHQLDALVGPADAFVLMDRVLSLRAGLPVPVPVPPE